MKNNLILTSLCWLLALVSSAQEISFTTSVSAKKVGVEDVFEVTYTANKTGTFIAPKYKSFNQVSAISERKERNVNLNTGEIIQKYSFSVALKPKKTGTFEVEGGQIKVGKVTYESKPVKVEVVEESQVRQRRRRAFDPFGMMDEMMQGFPSSQPRQIEITEKDFFAKISVSKSNVMKGEGLLASYKIYARNFNFGLDKYDFPTQKNFWTENIEIPTEIKPSQEVIEGVQYQVYTMKKELLFPQKSGELVLNPFELTARIQTSPFSNPLSKSIKSNSPRIVVNKLPANPPASFVNQVGNYSMEVKLTNDSVKVNEPIELSVTLSGKGNLKQLTEIPLYFDEQLEVYDPEVEVKLSVSEAGVKGSKTFNYLIIPRNPGIYELPSIAFSYFDLSTNSYQTINWKSRTVKVVDENGATKTSLDTNETNLSENQEEVAVIKLETNTIWKFLAAVLGLTIISLLVWFFLKRSRKEETEEERKRNARKKLAHKLSIAKSYLEQGNVSQFYHEILIGLNKYVNEKLSIETSKMTKDSIRTTLVNKGVKEETIQSFVRMLEACEMAKYAPLSNQNNQLIYENSLDVIEEIETQIS